MIQAIYQDQSAELHYRPRRQLTTPSGMRVACYELPLERIPADFFADPDGLWSFEALAAAAGFHPDAGVAIGALKKPFNGHLDGSAVVTLNVGSRPYVAIVECPIAYVYVSDSQSARVTAA
ncbi:MAG TPA: hypothetical protein VER33_12205 [Polyangiaceae bacterium]|nr:hypothetical protein [Polyangiaceae bacterium]